MHAALDWKLAKAEELSIATCFILKETTVRIFGCDSEGEKGLSDGKVH